MEAVCAGCALLVSWSGACRALWAHASTKVSRVSSSLCAVLYAHLQKDLLDHNVVKLYLEAFLEEVGGARAVAR